MVEMMSPGEDDLVLDPACGSGGFLVMVLDHVRHKIAKELYPNEEGALLEDRANSDPEVIERAQSYANSKLYGVDFDDDLKRAARMNMVMSGDGHGNILCLNSLQYPNTADPDTALMDTILQKQRTEYEAQDDISLGTFDYVFTNPPFGVKIPIDDPVTLNNFDLGHKWKTEDGKFTRKGTLQSAQPPEILFIERCYQFLKPGGIMAIVLPDGILGNPDSEYVRYWILQNMKVLASIDLPVETFLPQVGVQASLLFLQRKTNQEKLLTEQPDYDVFMAIAEKVGKDRRGNQIYMRDEDGAELIFPKIVESIQISQNGDRTVRSQEFFPNS